MANDKTAVFHSVTVPCEITFYEVANLLCSGFEGGVGYWCRIIDYTKPEKLDVTLDKLSAEIYGKDAAENRIYKHIDYVLNPGGEVVLQAFEMANECHPIYGGGKVLRQGFEWIEDEEGRYVCPVCKKLAPTYTLTHESLKRGLDIMREKYPRHFNDIVGCKGDAITGDVFIQSCLFGEIVFG